MSQDLTLEMIVGQPNVLTQDKIKEVLAAAEYEEVEGSWSVDLEKTTDGLAILADTGSDNITIIPSKNDVYELVLVNGEFEINFMVTATEEAEENTTEETPPVDTVVDTNTENQPSLGEEETPLVVENTTTTQEAPVDTSTETPVVTTEVDTQSAPAGETPPDVDYTPPEASKEYDPDAEFNVVVNNVKTQLEEYSSKMHYKAMLTVDNAVRMQMKLLSTVLSALTHGGRKTELAMRVIMEEFSDPVKAEEVYKVTLINRYVDESFRTQKQRNLFKDLMTLLSIGSKVGRMKVTNHFDLRRMEANFDNPKHYTNLCTYFSVKD